jgi:hypothetical protein
LRFAPIFRASGSFSRPGSRSSFFKRPEKARRLQLTFAIRWAYRLRENEGVGWHGNR